MTKHEVRVCIDPDPTLDTGVFRIGAAYDILRFLIDADDSEFTIPELVDATDPLVQRYGELWTCSIVFINSNRDQIDVFLLLIRYNFVLMNCERRKFLMATGLATSLSASGCLRLAENGTRSSGNTYNVRRLHLNTLTRDPERLLEEDALGINAEESEAENISGEWTGDSDIMWAQTCGKYVMEILENGSPIASTGERILIYNYRYALRQTDNSLFITSHPSVKDNWDIVLQLTYPGGDHTLSPNARLPEGTFEFDLANANIDSGRYNWSLNITPPNSFTININTFNDEQLVSVNPDSSQEFPTRESAIKNVGSLSTTQSQEVESPTNSSRDGLKMDGGGHNGGSLSDFDYGQELSADVSVGVNPPVEFGSQTSRRFRVRNLTTDQQVMFEPT